MNASMPLDPAIAELCSDTPPASPFDWAQLESAFGCSRETYYAGLANMQVMAGERLVAGYRALGHRARKVRHLAIAEGMVPPPHRMTPSERIKAEARRWGHAA